MPVPLTRFISFFLALMSGSSPKRALLLKFQVKNEVVFELKPFKNKMVAVGLKKGVRGRINMIFWFRLVLETEVL